MFAALALAFLIVPFAELFVLIKVGQVVGALPTIAVLVGVSIAGAWLVKREGLGVVNRARAQVQAGRVPASELVDGVLILFAGALLLTPGFLTDLVGFVLLVPPVRAALRAFASRRIARRTGLSNGRSGGRRLRRR